jgi:hypothetical protein
MDEEGKELTSAALWSLFSKTYLLADAPLELITHKTFPGGAGLSNADGGAEAGRRDPDDRGRWQRADRRLRRRTEDDLWRRILLPRLSRARSRARRQRDRRLLCEA